MRWPSWVQGPAHSPSPVCGFFPRSCHTVQEPPQEPPGHSLVLRPSCSSLQSGRGWGRLLAGFLSFSSVHRGLLLGLALSQHRHTPEAERTQGHCHAHLPSQTWGRPPPPWPCHLQDLRVHFEFP